MLRNKLHWNLNWNSYIFIPENASENAFWKYRPFCLGFNVLTSPEGLVTRYTIVLLYNLSRVINTSYLEIGLQGLTSWTCNGAHGLRADSRFAPSQGEMSLLCNDVSHWLGESLKSALWAGGFYTGAGIIFFFFFVFGAGVRRYFDPHDILTPGSKYRNDILTPLTIFWPPYNNQWKSYIFLLYLLNKVCYYINIILINFQQW